ncbi:MAG TPA: proton-conducting transporter membrane subunit [Lachnospiraceae bacterium]|jgi:multicomponent Na+:H+ antiporter subunit D|nr:proton-conducting transporter membrane subunit [Lachnospiraceae bacterium]
MLLIISILFPMIAGILVSCAKVKDSRTRHFYYAAVTVLSDILGILALCFGGSVTVLSFSENVTMAFSIDNVGRWFMAAVMMLYTAVSFYAFEYMKMEDHENVFFAFYYVSFGALLSVCEAGNLVTVYFCFEMATLTSVPLVLHDRTKEAISAGLKYLFYSIGGALMGLMGVFFVYYYSGAGREFVSGGFLDAAKAAGHEPVILAAVFVAIVGFGTKAGMYPMHGWLPTAHPVAPAPASALLSGIIAKAGIIAVIRLVYYSVGTDFLKGTWVQYAWMSLAMLTIFMGSMMAFMEKNLKKRLAYSTVSQISYIMLGLSLMSPEGMKGGLLHVMCHAASKGCLFLVAGVFIYKLGKRNVAELKGVGKQMPVTMWCFMIASLSLVGIPPMGGFVSKWYIASAAVGDGMGAFAILPPVILLLSALLTAGYLFPVAIDAFFPGKDFDTSKLVKAEPNRLMTIPMIALCAVALAVGLFGSRLF